MLQILLYITDKGNGSSNLNDVSCVRLFKCATNHLKYQFGSHCILDHSNKSCATIIIC